jgi:hypothetical protein
MQLVPSDSIEIKLPQAGLHSREQDLSRIRIITPAACGATQVSRLPKAENIAKYFYDEANRQLAGMTAGRVRVKDCTI